MLRCDWDQWIDGSVMIGVVEHLAERVERKGISGVVDVRGCRAPNRLR